MLDSIPFITKNKNRAQTIVLLTIRRAKDGRELFENDIESINIEANGVSVDGVVMTPDIPRTKRYWKVHFHFNVYKARVVVKGGPHYQDIMMDVTIDPKRRFTNMLILMERK